jgi:hypothetical protein
MNKAETEMMIKGTIVLAIIAYILAGIPNLTAEMLNKFDNIMVRILIIGLVVLSALYDPIICLLLAVGFILTHNQLQEVKNNQSNSAIRNLQIEANNKVVATEMNELVVSSIDDNKLMPMMEENNAENNLNSAENDLAEMAENNLNSVENNLVSVENDLASAENELDSAAENSMDMPEPQLMVLIERDNVVNRAVADVNHFFDLEDAMDAMGSNRVPMADYNNVVSSVNNGYSAQGIDNRL